MGVSDHFVEIQNLRKRKQEQSFKLKQKLDSQLQKNLCSNESSEQFQLLKQSVGFSDLSSPRKSIQILNKLNTSHNSLDFGEITNNQ